MIFHLKCTAKTLWEKKLDKADFFFFFQITAQAVAEGVKNFFVFNIRT